MAQAALDEYPQQKMVEESQRQQREIEEEAEKELAELPPVS